MSGKWLVSGLAVVIVCTTCGMASAQVGVSPIPPSNVGYYPGPDLSQPVSYSNASTNALLTADEPSLAEQMADLQAWREQMEGKEAAAKKKAAGKMSTTVGGRVHLDWANFSNDANYFADQQNGTEFREARFFIKGSGFHVFNYKINFGLAENKVSMKDVFMGVSELPVLGNVRVGHYKEPFGLEQLTSSNFTTFMERANISNTFAPSRHIGVMAFDVSENERFTWWAGAFASQGGPFQRDDHQATSFTGRVTYLPWYDEATQGRGLLHTGVAYSHRDAFQDGILSSSMRPIEGHLGHTYDASVANVDYVDQVGAEVAWVYGPMSLQSEYMFVTITDLTGADATLDGFYIFASYFLTGESRNYSRPNATFGRVKPHENFFRVRGEDGDCHTGKGAWELAYRWSTIDLGDGFVTNDRFSNHTFGLNWYLNPNMRLMWNYIHSKGDPIVGANGYADAYMMRAQVDF